ncbi:HPr family phosphocarrier protein [uncultured Flavonifractor sp.]|uniref:HPr family phosphocarrier protein n=1 Tax=uncultured Flavonifractor sp. TaxID=1193534 RepID=UPI002614D9A3|nr:HPr family phosphocarrier protein [uncultured Flavonifractor sp.]
MSSFEVSLSSIEDVRRFVDAASRCACEIDVCSGRYVTDGKSIMGLFSLDLSKPVRVVVQGTADDELEFERNMEALGVRRAE